MFAAAAVELQLHLSSRATRNTAAIRCHVVTSRLLELKIHWKLFDACRVDAVMLSIVQVCSSRLVKSCLAPNGTPPGTFYLLISGTAAVLADTKRISLWAFAG